MTGYEQWVAAGRPSAQIWERRVIAIRDCATGHRIWDARSREAPTETRRLPMWIWPLELAARWRARLEGRYG